MRLKSRTLRIETEEGGIKGIILSPRKPDACLRRLCYNLLGECDD